VPYIAFFSDNIFYLLVSASSSHFSSTAAVYTNNGFLPVRNYWFMCGTLVMWVTRV